MAMAIIHGSEASETIDMSDLVTINADLIYGYGGNDHILGFDGNDTIYGGEDDDWLEGMDDNDILKAAVAPIGWMAAAVSIRSAMPTPRHGSLFPRTGPRCGRLCGGRHSRGHREPHRLRLQRLADRQRESQHVSRAERQ
jgi:hemolysin type calcium-binding protein